MSKTTIPSSLRKRIIATAGNRCEYCGLPAEFALYTLEIDHIIPEKQGGPTDFDNLALACRFCNSYKGVSVISYDYITREVTLLFHPREQKWLDHFQLHPRGEIKGITDVGNATISVLRLNEQIRIEARERLISNGVLTPDS